MAESNVDTAIIYRYTLLYNTDTKEKKTTNLNDKIKNKKNSK